MGKEPVYDYGVTIFTLRNMYAFLLPMTHILIYIVYSLQNANDSSLSKSLCDLTFKDDIIGEDPYKMS